MSNNEQYKVFEDEYDMNKNIKLHTDSDQSLKQVSHDQQHRPKFLNKMIDKKEEIAVGMMLGNEGGSASEKLSANIMDKVHNRLDFIGKYFNVEVDDIKQK